MLTPRSEEATVPTLTSYAHLSVSFHSSVPPTAVMVRIKASKIDLFRQGVTVCLGRTGQELCPEAALMRYISRRGTEAGPLFRFVNGRPLVAEMRSALQSRGFNTEAYSGHSFRIGAVAAAVRVEDALIKILGRWQSTAYLQYVRFPRSDLTGISARLAAQ